MKPLIALTTAFALTAATAAPSFAQSTDDDDDAFIAAASSAAPSATIAPATAAIMAGVGLALVLAVANSSTGTR